jgi:hypothetical protein
MNWRDGDWLDVMHTPPSRGLWWCPEQIASD